MSLHKAISSPTQSGKRTSISTKILLAASLALLTGLVIVGGAALYLDKQALVGLQRGNSLNFVNVMADDIKTTMMAGDMKKVDADIKDIVGKNRAVAFSIYNAQGEVRGSGAKGDALVCKGALCNRRTNNGKV